jgi:hypothetical protein
MKHFNQWSKKRTASFLIHSFFVSVPFIASTISAVHFWETLTGQIWLAIGMMVVVEVLALTGLVLHITRIESPFTGLRHFLPVISVVPLGWELSRLLSSQNNPTEVVWGATVTVTVIFVFVSWRCFTTIERLFIDPVEAAREKAYEETRAFEVFITKHAREGAIINRALADMANNGTDDTVLAVVTSSDKLFDMSHDTNDADDSMSRHEAPVMSLPATRGTTDDDDDDTEYDTPSDTIQRVTTPRPNDADKDDIIKRVLSGVMTEDEAAERVGKSVRTIQRWVSAARNGVTQ